MSELLGRLTGSLPFVVGVLLVAVALLALLLFLLLNRARDAATYADLGAGGGEAGGTKLEVLDLRSSPSEAEMKESARQALELIGQVHPGPRARYEVPWFLTLGQTDSGKSNLVANSGLRPPFGEPDETDKGCLWWLFDRAVVLDVAGDLVLRRDGTTSDQPAWSALLDLVQQSRPKRPVDGVLLTLPLPQLLTYDPAQPATQTALAHQAELLRARLDDVRRILGVEFPVFTVVTQCDRLPGFAALVAGLEAGEAEQMLGWSVRTSPAIAYSDAWVDDAFESVTGALDRLQLRALQDGKVPPEPRAWLALPATLAALREPVRIFWSRIFGGGTLDSALPVRGLYFTGGEGFANEGADLHPPVPGYRTFEGGSETGRHHRVDFVSDLFARKILFEWSLARPVKGIARRALSLRSALQAALVAALVLGPLALLYGHRRLAADADTLSREFVLPTRCALRCTPPGARPTRGAALDVLRAIRPVESYTLRSAWLPASWWNPFTGRVEQTGIEAYGRVVFPALEHWLDTDLTALAARPARFYPREPVQDLATLPELRDFASFVDQATRLDRQVHVYQEVAPGSCGVDEDELLARFQDLVRAYAPEVSPVPPAGAEGFYEDVLCLASGPDFPHEAVKRKLQVRARRDWDEVTHRLFTENALLVDLDDLEGRIDDLSQRALPAAQANAAYEDLLDTIDRTKSGLARTQPAFANRTAANLGAAYRQLTDRVARLDLLGPELAKAMDERARVQYEELRQRLAGFQTDATGALLAQEKGEVQLQLSSSVLGLEAALRSLLKDYAAPRQGRPFLDAPPAGTYLAWNPQTLQQAVDLNANYVDFMGKKFTGFPGFQQIVQKSSRQSVEANVLDLVAQGQLFPGRPDPKGREQLEAFLAARVANLRQAAPPLNSLLAFLTKPPAAQGCAVAPTLAYCRLGGAVRDQEIDLIDQLDRLRAALALYTPVPGAFAEWEGSAQENLAWRAFGVADDDGLAAYLTNQRRIVQTLDDSYAEPTLTDVQLGADVGPVTSDAIRRWRLIRTDLTDYKNKVPDNPLLALETYISSGMGKATAASCLSLPAASDACFATTTPAGQAWGLPCDLFLQIRYDLQTRLEPRCTQLNYDDGKLAWGRIQGEFDLRLAGRYPFGGGADPAARAASPADLDLFFAVFDKERGTVENLLAAARASRAAPRSLPPSPWTEQTETEVRIFLEQMGAVRKFFALYLDRKAPPAPKPTADAPTSDAPTSEAAAPPAPARPRLPDVPAFGVRVDYRPVPNAEQGGNEVIDRQLALVPVRPTSASSMVWRYDTPLRLSVRWAKDSLAVPQPSTPASPFVVNGRSVTWNFSDPWSLLRLLDRLAEKNGPPGRLQLDVPVAPAQDVPGSEEKRAPKPPATVSPAILYMDVQLTTPDASQTVLAVPVFPPAAPEGN